MTITRDQTGTGTTALESGTQVITWATAPAAGSKVLVFVATTATGSTPTSVKDNGTTQSTFTQDVVNTLGGAAYSGVWRADGISLPASGSYAVTVTFGASGDFAITAGRSYAGAATGAPAASSGTGSGTSGSVNTGNVTPAASGSLVFGGFLDDSSANPESITLTTSGASSVYSSTNGTLLPGAAADNTPAGTSAQALAWTLGDAPDWGTVVAVYSPAVPATASPVQVVVAPSRAAIQAASW